MASYKITGVTSWKTAIFKFIALRTKGLTDLAYFLHKQNCTKHLYALSSGFYKLRLTMQEIYLAYILGVNVPRFRAVDMSNQPTNTYARTHTHTRARAHTHIHIYLYIYTYMHTHKHIYIHTHTHTQMHAYIHTYARTYIHTYIHTYIRTYIHTQYTHTHTSQRKS
jgi:hypothetical protein